MDDERRIAPKRLLSFEASQMSLARLGKALYSGPTARAPDHVTRKPSVIMDAGNNSVEYDSKSPIACMAVSYENSMAALVSKEGLRIVKINGPNATMIKSTKINNSQRLMPTAATWQSRVQSIADIDETTPPHLTNAGSHLAVTDSNGTFRIYGFKGSTGGAEVGLLSSSTSVGRAIRSASFNTEQQNILVTAVSDGSTRCWDLRQGLRRPVQVFARPGDVSREVQFQPGSDYKFASIYDSGVVQRWDIRQRQMPDCRINAHQQGLSLDWHPRLNYLATGGRDHLIQIWNMNTDSSTTTSDLLGGRCPPEYVIQVPNSVSNVSWLFDSAAEPIWKSNVVSSGRPIESNNLKGTYSVWSLSRPHIPTYTVETHKDAITSIEAVSNNLVWSAGLDGKLVQTDLRFEPKVIDNFPPAIVAMPPWDMAAVSFPCIQSSTAPTTAPTTPAAGAASGTGAAHNTPQTQITTPPSFTRRVSQHTIHNKGLGPPYAPSSLNLSPTGNAGSITNRRPAPIRENSQGLQRAFSTAALASYVPHNPHSSGVSETAPGSLAGSLHTGSGFPVGFHTGSGSAAGSSPGSNPESLAGSNPGSVPGSKPGSALTSAAVSQPGSTAGSVPGSAPGSVPGSMPGSLQRSTPLNSGNLFIANNAMNPSFFNALGNAGAAGHAATPSPVTPNIGGLGTNDYFNHFEDGEATDLKYIIEVGLPFEDGKNYKHTALAISYTRKEGQTYGQVCRENAKVMLDKRRFRYSEVWSLLAVAIEQQEAAFLRLLAEEGNKEEEQVAKDWFLGHISDDYESRAMAIDDRMGRAEGSGDGRTDSGSGGAAGGGGSGSGATGYDAAALFDEAEVETDGEYLHDGEWPVSPHNNGDHGGSLLSHASTSPSHHPHNPWTGSRRRHRHQAAASSSNRGSSLRGSTHTGGSSLRYLRGNSLEMLRPAMEETDPFQVLKAKYWDFVATRNNPWDFIPYLKKSIKQSLRVGYFNTCIALVMVFRAVPFLCDHFNLTEIVLGGLHAFDQNGAFTAAAHVRKLLRKEVDNGADWFDKDMIFGPLLNSESNRDAPDTVCHRCLRSLSDNAAFYSRNDTTIGYWYCERCKLPLDGCALCDEPITGLCNVNLGCGHRTHIHCWTQWVEVEGMQECPSGCGQPITYA